MYDTLYPKCNADDSVNLFMVSKSINFPVNSAFENLYCFCNNM
jgi:hypothetical protein